MRTPECCALLWQPGAAEPALSLSTPDCCALLRRAQTDALRKQLDAGNVVLLSNLGYSAAGEVLNCDIYTVATRAAVDLQVGRRRPGGRDLRMWWD